jgi:hypothetical protein
MNSLEKRHAGLRTLASLAGQGLIDVAGDWMCSDAPGPHLTLSNGRNGVALEYRQLLTQAPSGQSAPWINGLSR